MPFRLFPSPAPVRNSDSSATSVVGLRQGRLTQFERLTENLAHRCTDGLDSHHLAETPPERCYRLIQRQLGHQPTTQPCVIPRSHGLGNVFALDISRLMSETTWRVPMAWDDSNKAK